MQPYNSVQDEKYLRSVLSMSEIGLRNHAIVYRLRSTLQVFGPRLGLGGDNWIQDQKDLRSVWAETEIRLCNHVIVYSMRKTFGSSVGSGADKTIGRPKKCLC